MTDSRKGKSTTPGDLQAFKDSLARSLFGMTAHEAHDGGVCIDCKQPIEELLRTAVELNEWYISGLCPRCFTANANGHRGGSQ